VGRTERARCDWRGNAAGRPRMHARSIVAKRRRQSHLVQCAVSSSPSLLVLPLRRQWDGLPFESNAGAQPRSGKRKGRAARLCTTEASRWRRGRQTTAQCEQRQCSTAARCAPARWTESRRSRSRARRRATQYGALTPMCGRVLAVSGRLHLRAHNGPRFSSPRPSPRHPCSRALSQEHARVCHSACCSSARPPPVRGGWRFRDAHNNSWRS
jgi:hypothetical protein